MEINRRKFSSNNKTTRKGLKRHDSLKFVLNSFMQVSIKIWYNNSTKRVSNGMN